VSTPDLPEPLYTVVAAPVDVELARAACVLAPAAVFDVVQSDVVEPGRFLVFNNAAMRDAYERAASTEPIYLFERDSRALLRHWSVMWVMRESLREQMAVRYAGPADVLRNITD
jgi:hypothetical protein